jgi:predicted small lipoprotein YifL
MIRKRMFSIILILIVLVSMTACGEKQNQGISFNIPEAEKLQKVLEDISQAVMAKNEDIISNSISEDCPNRKLELEALKELMDSMSLKSYSPRCLPLQYLQCR